LILRVLEPRRMRLETTMFSFKTSKLELSLFSLSGYGTDANDCISCTRLLNVHYEIRDK